MGAKKRKALHDGSQELREEDGGVRSRTFADRVPDDGEPLDPRIDRLVRLMARQAARDTVDAWLKRRRHDEEGDDQFELLSDRRLPMTRAAIYARYSSDNQREASIEDQVRICKEFGERQGWTMVKTYADHAISGASLLLRPGIQQLIAGAGTAGFDVILAESLDRLSRDQEDIAGVYKRMTFAGVRIVTPSEGEISELHIGLMGTMTDSARTVKAEVLPKKNSQPSPEHQIWLITWTGS